MKQPFKIVFVVSEVKHINSRDNLDEKNKTEPEITTIERSSDINQSVVEDNNTTIEENKIEENKTDREQENTTENIFNTIDIIIPGSTIISPPEKFLNQENYTILQGGIIIRRDTIKEPTNR